MSADRVRFVHGIAAKLHALGCSKVEQVDEYNSLWRCDATGKVFGVPMDGGDKCPEVMWPDVAASAAKAAIPD